MPNDTLITGNGAGIPSAEIGLAISKEETGTALAIHLSQDSRSAAVWTFDVVVQTNEGERFLGRFTVRPPVGGDPPARVVCFAFCPGAKDWRVVPFGPQGATAYLTLSSSHLSVSGVFGLVAVNGSRVSNRNYPAPQFAVGQGILSPGPGTLFTLTGFSDPAQPLVYVGPVDKAAAVVGGDVFAYAPVQLPAGGANFALTWEPDGLPFLNQIRWAASGAPNPIALGPVATVGAKVG